MRGLPFGVSVAIVATVGVVSGHKVELIGAGRCLDSGNDRYDHIEFTGSAGNNIANCQAKCEEVVDDQGMFDYFRGIEIYTVDNRCRCNMENGNVPTDPGDASGRDLSQSGSGDVVGGNGNAWTCYKFIFVDPCVHRLGVVVDRTWEGGQTTANNNYDSAVSFATDFITDLGGRIGADNIRVGLSIMTRKNIRKTTRIDDSEGASDSSLLSDLGSGDYVLKGIPGVFTYFPGIFDEVLPELSSSSVDSSVVVVSDGNERNGKRTKFLRKRRRTYRRRHRGGKRSKVLCYSPLEITPGTKMNKFCDQIWKVNEEGGKSEVEIITEITNHMCPPRSLSDPCSDLGPVSCEAVMISSDGTLGGDYNLCYWSNRQNKCRVRGKYAPLIDFSA